MRNLIRTATCCASALAATAALTLGAPAPAFAHPAPAPSVDCDLHHRQLAIVYVGYATATSDHPAPTELTIICSYTNKEGRYVSINSSPGYAVATFGTGLLSPGEMEICETAIARYADGAVATTSSCHPPQDPFDPLDPLIAQVLDLLD